MLMMLLLLLIFHSPEEAEADERQQRQLYFRLQPSATLTWRPLRDNGDVRQMSRPVRYIVPAHLDISVEMCYLLPHM